MLPWRPGRRGRSSELGCPGARLQDAVTLRDRITGMPSEQRPNERAEPVRVVLGSERVPVAVIVVIVASHLSESSFLVAGATSIRFSVRLQSLGSALIDAGRKHPSRLAILHILRPCSPGGPAHGAWEGVTAPARECRSPPPGEDPSPDGPAPGDSRPGPGVPRGGEPGPMPGPMGLVMVTPQTLLRWHRELLRRFTVSTEPVDVSGFTCPDQMVPVLVSATFKNITLTVTSQTGTTT